MAAAVDIYNKSQSNADCVDDKNSPMHSIECRDHRNRLECEFISRQKNPMCQKIGVFIVLKRREKRRNKRTERHEQVTLFVSTAARVTHRNTPKQIRSIARHGNRAFFPFCPDQLIAMTEKSINHLPIRYKIARVPCQSNRICSAKSGWESREGERKNIE